MNKLAMLQVLADLAVEDYLQENSKKANLGGPVADYIANMNARGISFGDINKSLGDGGTMNPIAYAMGRVKGNSPQESVDMAMGLPPRTGSTGIGELLGDAIGNMSTTEKILGTTAGTAALAGLLYKLLQR